MDATICNDGLMVQNIPWPWRGGPEHAAEMHASEIIQFRVHQIDRGLDLIAWAIQRSAESVNQLRASNELSALACYTRAFRGLRAATILATEGLYLEARVYTRDVYESAGLGRLLAMNPSKADEWLLRQRWIKDNEVRQFIEGLIMPGVSQVESPYREYYRHASELHHPTMRGSLPLVLKDATSDCEPQLESHFDLSSLDSTLREIAIETTFVCFTMIRAVSDEAVIDPDWRHAVNELAIELAEGFDMSHLVRDWEADHQRFEELQRHVVTSPELDTGLDHHPNSVRNMKLRREPANEE